ncbi:MAG TPA: flagellar export protein FliJ [Cellulomonas sp.]
MSRFTLAGLLRLRGLREDEAAAALGAAERAAAAADMRARHTAERLSGTDLPSAVDGATFLAAAAGRLSLSWLLIEDTDRVHVARAVAVERRTEWSRTRQEERAVERLEEHHEERERAQDLRAEQVVLDEVAGRRKQEGP